MHTFLESRLHCEDIVIYFQYPVAPLLLLDQDQDMVSYQHWTLPNTIHHKTTVQCVHVHYIICTNQHSLVLLTTSDFSENIPSWILSIAIHLTGNLTDPEELLSLNWLKYSFVYISSVRPKSPTLTIPSSPILYII